MRGREGNVVGGEGKAVYRGDKMHPNSNVFFLTTWFYLKPGGVI